MDGILLAVPLFVPLSGCFWPGDVFIETTCLGGAGGLIPGGRVDALEADVGRVADLLEGGGVLGVVRDDDDPCFASFFSCSLAGW